MEKDSYRFIISNPAQSPELTSGVGSRAFWVQIETSIYELREEMFSAVGEDARAIFYRLGLKDAARLIATQPERFRSSLSASLFQQILVEEFEHAAGQFRVLHLDRENGTALIEAENSFEGWAYVRNSHWQNEPCCDYMRGFLSGLLNACWLANSRDNGMVLAAETRCIARGDPFCRFELTRSKMPDETNGKAELSTDSAERFLRLQPATISLLGTLSTSQPDEMPLRIQQAIQRTLDLIGFSLAVIRLASPDQHWLEAVGACGTAEGMADLRRPIGVANSIEARVFHSGEREVVQHANLSGDSYARLLSQSGIRSFACLPIKASDKTIGTLLFGSRLEPRVSTQVIHFMTGFAHQLGAAIENARLLEEMRLANLQLSDQVSSVNELVTRQNYELAVLNDIGVAVSSSLNLKHTMKSVGPLILNSIGYEGFAIYVLNDDRTELEMEAHLWLKPPTLARLPKRIRVGESYAGKVALSGEPILLDNFSEVSTEETHRGFVKGKLISFAAIPLIAHGQVVGVLDVGTLKYAPLDRMHLQLLLGIGRVLGISIQNAKMYQRSQRQMRFQRMQNRIISAMRRAISLEQVIHITLQELFRVLKASRCYFADAGRTGEINILYEHNRPGMPSILGLHQFNASIEDMDQRLKRGEAIVICDCESDPRTKPFLDQFHRPYSVRSSIMAPVLSHGKLVALLAIHQCDHCRKWADDEVALVDAIAHQTSLTIENGKLFENLKRSQQEYQTLFEESPDFYHILDTEGRIIRCNGTEAQGLGYSTEEIIGKSHTDLVAPSLKKRAISWWNQLQKSETPLTGETQLVTATGQRIEVAIRGIPIRQADGRFAGARVSSRDITAENQLRAHLFRVQKMECVNTLASGIAHDFNNLLTGILGFSSLLKQRLEHDPTGYHYAEMVERSARQTSELVQRILAFSRGGPGTITTLDVNPVIRDTIALMKTMTDGNGVTILTQLWGDPINIRGDASKMQQAILNLLMNARDAIPDGGSILVSTLIIHRTLDTTKPELVSKSEPCVAISVRDTGVGMTPATRRRIFDPFFTTKETGKGTGLGLAIVNTVVTEMGGRIEVESRVGQGSEFTLMLHLA